MTLMIALVGGQPLPNLLPVRRYTPESLLLIYTPQTKKTYEQLQDVLQKETHVHGLKTDAYDIFAIINALNAELDKPEFTDLPTTFNITGGTKIMSLAAYQVAQQRTAPVVYIESEKQRNYVYYYEWENQQLKVQSNELLPEYVTLSDLFNIYFGMHKWTEDGPSQTDGGSFEIALAEALQSHGYETKMGIHAMDGQIDIDVALRFGNQFGILEAKAGSGGTSLNGIRQLNNAIPHLGTFTKKFYAITVEPEPRHEVIRAESNIHLIQLSQYVPKSRILTQADTDKLFSVVDKAMKGK